MTQTENTPVGSNTRSQLLYQPYPKVYSTYNQHKNRSFTNDRESYQYGAEKETSILRHNGRIPTTSIVLHFLVVLSVLAIKAYRKKIFRILQRKGIESVVSIELTRTMPKIGKPNNKVHFHFLTDDKRSEKELRALFNNACTDSGLDPKDFRIDYKNIDEGYWYFDYFTKYDRANKGKYRENGNNGDWRHVLLFAKGLRLQKFYRIGKWFKKSKKQIWKEIQEIMQAKSAFITTDGN